MKEQLRAVPLLGALVPMVAGIVAGTLVPVPLYVWIVSAVICVVTAWLLLFPTRKSGHNRIPPWAFPLYVGLAILFFGASLARIHTPRQEIPRGERVWMEIVLTDAPARLEGRRSASANGTVTRWRPETGEWQPSRERLLVSVDTMWRLGAGDRITFRGYVNPIADTANSYLRFPPSHLGHSSKLDGSRFGVGYSRLMGARGFSGRTYITQYSLPSVAAEKAKTPGAWARKLQAAATERLRRLNVNANAAAVLSAMTTGDRGGITPALRQSYSRTGASHLLAVSGLHVGIVFLIVNLLLYLLPLAPRGHIARNIVAACVIWLYASLTGLSPSAMRAAFMFTGAQIALATSQTRGPINIMCGTALVMLAVRPGLVFDISFQLSFIAVAAIMAWFAPLYRLVESRFRLLNALWATLIVGFCASLATMPLVSHTFGVFSPAGMVLNPLVIATAHIIVAASLVWIAAPVPWLEPVFRWLVGGPAWLQNHVVEAVSAVPGAAVEWTMPIWMVFAVYAAMIIFTAWVATVSAKKHAEEDPFVLPR